MASIVYTVQKTDFLKGEGSLTSDAIKVALLTSSYAPSAAHDEYQDVFAYEVTGTGYDAGGKVLGDKARTKDDTNDEAYFDSTSNMTWDGSTITARYAVLYYTGGELAQQLICCIDFGSDQSSTNGDFTIQWNDGGILALT